MVRVAARTGYRWVGLRLIPVTDDSLSYPIMDDPVMMRETKAALADTGVRLSDIEFVKITPDIDVAALESFVAAGASLGARHILTGPYDHDHSRLSDNLAGIASLAGNYGLSALLEFFPWTTVPDLATSAQIVGAAARPNAGILLDTLHFDRSDSSLSQIGSIPPAWFPMIHLCDAPAEKPTTTEGILHTARAERLPPGEGGINLAPILGAIPDDVQISLEVPMQEMTRREGPEAVARHVHDAAVRFLAQLP
jgi:sugar phosphate isomerase/epimerase